MNLKEIEYIVKISEEGSVARAAEKLFITPSALTQQLLHLEKEIGTQLFFRSRSGWTPTEAGEVYLESARQILRIKRDTYARLRDITAASKGFLSIGFPPERGAALFTSVYPAFHKAYPGIVINVAEVSVRRQQQMIAKGDLDIGFMNLCEWQRTNDDYLVIGKEEMLLVLPAGHPLCKEAAPAGQGRYPILPIKALSQEPLALMSTESTVRDFTETYFRQYNFQPNILFETARARTIIDMVASNMCCGIIPSYYTRFKYSNIAYFSLPDHPTWEITVCHKKGSYLSQAARHFIELTKEYWS